MTEQARTAGNTLESTVTERDEALKRATDAEERLSQSDRNLEDMTEQAKTANDTPARTTTERDDALVRVESAENAVKQSTQRAESAEETHDGFLKRAVAAEKQASTAETNVQAAKNWMRGGEGSKEVD